jgi:hypothetical protein
MWFQAECVHTPRPVDGHTDGDATTNVLTGFMLVAAAGLGMTLVTASITV